MYPLCIKLIGLNQFIYLLAHFCSVSSPHFPLGAHMISSNTFCRAIYLSLVPRHFVRPCHRARALGPGQSRPAHPTRHPQLARHAPPGSSPPRSAPRDPGACPITRPHLLPASLQIIYGDKKSRKRESAGDRRDDKI